MSEEEVKITMPPITELELEKIDNNLHEIVNEFIKTTVKDKELLIAQYIIKRLEKKNQQLRQQQEHFIKWLEDEIKETTNAIERLDGTNSCRMPNLKIRLSTYQETLEKIKKLKGSDKQ